MPQVSIIIPAYNAARFIGKTLESVLAQTLQDREIIVIDDGSKDDTAQVVAGYAGVRYVHQPNAGVSAARNHGARVARGEYLAFLDADDIWHPAKLELQMQAFARHPQSIFGRTQITKDTQLLEAFSQLREVPPLRYHLEPDFETSFFYPYLTTSTVVVTRRAFEAVGGFDTQLRIAEDIDFYLRVLADAPAVLVIDEPMVFKRPVEGSLGDDSAAGYVKLKEVYQRFLDARPDVRQSLGPKAVAKAFYMFQISLAKSLLWSGQASAARKAAVQALSYGVKPEVLGLILRSLLPVGLLRQAKSVLR